MEQRDEQLWRTAVRRASFQRSLVIYVVVIGFLWLLWWFTAGMRGINRDLPWPIWAMMGWGIGLFFQYMGAYGRSRQDLIQKEYERLKQRQKN